MKTKRKANENERPESIQPIAVVGSGEVTACLWESQSGLQFMLGRLDRVAEDVVPQLRPQDIEHVARLAALIAEVFHRILDGETSDDLGCLAHSLAQTLGVDFDDSLVIRPRATH